MSELQVPVLKLGTSNVSRRLEVQSGVEIGLTEREREKSLKIRKPLGLNWLNSKQPLTIRIKPTNS